jgi:phenylalanine-4-hydroxylase
MRFFKSHRLFRHSCNRIDSRRIVFPILVERKFPSTCFIRREDQIDYLQEPDVFHDVYGHVPLLVNPIFANFMEEFGRKGLEAIKMGLYSYAASLYWFTVEFGLIQTKKGLRIYGAESPLPKASPFTV